MNLFTSKRLAWWQVGVIKGGVLCFGIAIGVYWSDVFVAHLTTLIALGAVLALLSVFIWMRK